MLKEIQHKIKMRKLNKNVCSLLTQMQEYEPDIESKEWTNLSILIYLNLMLMQDEVKTKNSSEEVESH